MKRIFEHKHYSTIMFLAIVLVSFLILFNLIPPEQSAVTGYQIAPIQKTNPILEYYFSLVILIIPILFLTLRFVKRFRNG
jgi:hypothetical protein